MAIGIVPRFLFATLMRHGVLRYRTDLERVHLPLSEQLADKLADALIALDDARFITACDEAGDLRAFDERLHAMYDEINQMMKLICD